MTEAERKQLEWEIDNIVYEAKKGDLTMARATDKILSLISEYTEQFKGASAHAVSEDIAQGQQVVTHFAKAGKRVFVVNGASELVTLDGRSVKFDPEDTNKATFTPQQKDLIRTLIDETFHKDDTKALELWMKVEKL